MTMTTAVVTRSTLTAMASRVGLPAEAKKAT
jgi:hypothetical protein